MKILKLRQVTAFFILSMMLFSFSASFALDIPETLTYDQIMTAEGMPTMTMKIYKKGDNLRIETQMQGRTSIIIKKGDKTIMYDPQINFAMDMSGTDEIDAAMLGGADPKDKFDNIDKTKVGEGKVEGEMCDIYEYNDENGKYKVWQSRKTKWPIKTEASTPKCEMTIEIKNLEMNKELSDSLFEVPQGVKLMNVSEMMQNAQRELMPDSF